jgi:predicted transcriptional regulator
MKILLSIKPEYAEKILNGTKRFEYRRSVFRNQAVRSVVIYATKPLGKVVGEFEIGGVISDTPRSLWSSTKEHSGISRAFFMQYFENRETAFAIRVMNPTRYDEPLQLQDLVGSSPAPQSFRYLES